MFRNIPNINNFYTDLLNTDELDIRHLVKFERPGDNRASEPKDFTYITDARFDTIYDDNSYFSGLPAGPQTYIANKLIKIGDFSETTKAAASSTTIVLDSVALGTMITDTYTFTETSITGSKDLSMAGFASGDVLEFSSTNENNSVKIRIDKFTNGNKTISYTPLYNSSVQELVQEGTLALSMPELSAFVASKLATSYTSYINREVLVYRQYRTSRGVILKTFLIFKGIISQGRLNEDNTKSSTMTWTLSSHWADFVKISGRKGTDSSHRSISSGSFKSAEGTLKREEYASDFGFMHADSSINMVAEFLTPHERLTIGKKKKLFGKKTSTSKWIEWLPEETKLAFNLTSEYIPVVYGVGRVKPSVVFADLLTSASGFACLATVSPICEGPISGILDAYFDGNPTVCLDLSDEDTRNSSASSSALVSCIGRADKGESLLASPVLTGKAQGIQVLGSANLLDTSITVSNDISGWVSYSLNGTPYSHTISSLVEGPLHIVLTVSPALPIIVPKDTKVTILNNEGSRFFNFSSINSPEGTSLSIYNPVALIDEDWIVSYPGSPEDFIVESVPAANNSSRIITMESDIITDGSVIATVREPIGVFDNPLVTHANWQDNSGVGGTALSNILGMSETRAPYQWNTTVGNSNYFTNNHATFFTKSLELHILKTGKPDQKSDSILTSVGLSSRNELGLVIKGTDLNKKLKSGYIYLVDSSTGDQGIVGATFKVKVSKVGIATVIDSKVKIVKTVKRVPNKKSEVTYYPIKSLPLIPSTAPFSITLRKFKMYKNRFVKGQGGTRASAYNSITATISEISTLPDTLGFKVQNDYYRDFQLDYWGHDHKLLDTAYVTILNRITSDDQGREEAEYVVKGKFIDCYNYDNSYALIDAVQIDSFFKGMNVGISSTTVASLSSIICAVSYEESGSIKFMVAYTDPEDLDKVLIQRLLPVLTDMGTGTELVQYILEGTANELNSSNFTTPTNRYRSKPSDVKDIYYSGTHLHVLDSFGLATYAQYGGTSTVWDLVGHTQIIDRWTPTDSSTHESSWMWDTVDKKDPRVVLSGTSITGGFSGVDSSVLSSTSTVEGGMEKLILNTTPNVRGGDKVYNGSTYIGEVILNDCTELFTDTNPKGISTVLQREIYITQQGARIALGATITFKRDLIFVHVPTTTISRTSAYSEAQYYYGGRITPFTSDVIPAQVLIYNAYPITNVATPFSDPLNWHGKVDSYGDVTESVYGSINQLEAFSSYDSHGASPIAKISTYHLPEYIVSKTDNHDIPDRSTSLNYYEGSGTLEFSHDVQNSLFEENKCPRGVTSDGTTVWVSDHIEPSMDINKEESISRRGHSIFSYPYADPRSYDYSVTYDSDEIVDGRQFNEILTHPKNNGSGKIYAYNASTGLRDPDKDIVPYLDKPIHGSITTTTLVGTPSFKVQDWRDTAESYTKNKGTYDQAYACEITVNHGSVSGGTRRPATGDKMHFEDSDLVSFIRPGASLQGSDASYFNVADYYVGGGYVSLPTWTGFPLPISDSSGTPRWPYFHDAPNICRVSYVEVISNTQTKLHLNRFINAANGTIINFGRLLDHVRKDFTISASSHVPGITNTEPFTTLGGIEPMYDSGRWVVKTRAGQPLDIAIHGNTMYILNNSFPNIRRQDPVRYTSWTDTIACSIYGGSVQMDDSVSSYIIAIDLTSGLPLEKTINPPMDTVGICISGDYLYALNAGKHGVTGGSISSNTTNTIRKYSLSNTQDPTYPYGFEKSYPVSATETFGRWLDTYVGFGTGTHHGLEIKSDSGTPEFYSLNIDPLYDITKGEAMIASTDAADISRAGITPLSEFNPPMGICKVGTDLLVIEGGEMFRENLPTVIDGTNYYYGGVVNTDTKALFTNLNIRAAKYTSAGAATGTNFNLGASYAADTILVQKFNLNQKLSSVSEHTIIKDPSLSGEPVVSTTISDSTSGQDRFGMITSANIHAYTYNTSGIAAYEHVAFSEDNTSLSTNVISNISKRRSVEGIVEYQVSFVDPIAGVTTDWLKIEDYETPDPSVSIHAINRSIYPPENSLNLLNSSNTLGPSTSATGSPSGGYISLTLASVGAALGLHKDTYDFDYENPALKRVSLLSIGDSILTSIQADWDSIWEMKISVPDVDSSYVWLNAGGTVVPLLIIEDPEDISEGLWEEAHAFIYQYGGNIHVLMSDACPTLLSGTNVLTNVFAASNTRTFFYRDIVRLSEATYPKMNSAEKISFRHKVGSIKETAIPLAFDANNYLLLNKYDSSTIDNFDGSTRYKLFTNEDEDLRVSTNPALQLLDYLTSDIYGKKLDIENEINLDSFIESAKLCDAKSNVTIVRLFNEGSTACSLGVEYYCEHPTSGDTMFKGTIAALNYVKIGGIPYEEITFNNVIGKLGKKHNDWQSMKNTFIWDNTSLLREGPTNTTPLSDISSLPIVNFSLLPTMRRLISAPGPTTFYPDIGRTTTTVNFTTQAVDNTLQVANLADTDDGMIGGYVQHELFSYEIIGRSNTTGSLFLDPTVLAGTISNVKAYVIWNLYLDDTKISNDSNPIVKSLTDESEGFTSTGYSLYDCDSIKYWRYIGWDDLQQDYVTRHQTNQVIDTGMSILDNVNSMLRQFNGILSYSSGVYSLGIKTKATEYPEKFLSVSSSILLEGALLSYGEGFVELPSSIQNLVDIGISRGDCVTMYTGVEYSIDYLEPKSNKIYLTNFDGNLEVDNINNDRSVKKCKGPQFIDDSDIIGKVKITDKSSKDAWNSISAKVIDPQLKYEGRDISFFNSDYLAQDNFIPKEGSYNAPGVSNYFNARMNVKQTLDASRFSLTLDFVMAPHGVALRPGIIVYMSLSRLSWNEKPFRIKKIVLKADGNIGLTVEEHSDSIYILNADGTTAVGSDLTIENPLTLNLEAQ